MTLIEVPYGTVHLDSVVDPDSWNPDRGYSISSESLSGSGFLMTTNLRKQYRVKFFSLSFTDQRDPIESGSGSALVHNIAFNNAADVSNVQKNPGTVPNQLQ
jgi:hypothetical protein